MKKETYLELRDKTVVKANDLIQKSRFNLSLQQQKMLLFLISQVTPYDEEFSVYEFSIQEFCRVCGIDIASGKNYQDVKQCIKDIADKSVWVTVDGDEETLLRWIEKPYINNKSGVLKVRLDEDMKPYLLQLKENFTRYELIYTLYFKSKYSIRLYELAKSIHYKELEEYRRTYTVDELKRLLGAETYAEYRDFKRRVLDIAVNEINSYSDKLLSYEPIKKGKSVVGIELIVNSKSIMDRLEIRSKIDKDMGNDQLSLYDIVNEANKAEKTVEPIEVEFV